MGRPASWYLWLQAVDVIWRGNVKPYWCLVSKCSLSGWKLLGKLRSYRFVPCGLGGSFQCWCCVCVCLICSWWCVDLVLFRMPRIIRSHAAAPRGHGCTQTTKKREGVLMIATISTFLSTRIAIRNNSETEIAIRDKIQTNPNKIVLGN